MRAVSRRGRELRRGGNEELETTGEVEAAGAFETAGVFERTGEETGGEVGGAVGNWDSMGGGLMVAVEGTTDKGDGEQWTVGDATGECGRTVESVWWGIGACSYSGALCCVCVSLWCVSLCCGGAGVLSL